MLNVFQSWEEVRQRGSHAEENFCEHKQLSIPTLRVTWEAKVSYQFNSHPYQKQKRPYWPQIDKESNINF